MRIKARNGTAAQWLAKNPTLMKGEIGVETDTYKLKIGDGATRWDSLPYATGSGGGGGVSDHGGLTGLLDDDHAQYFNQTRGDARYALASHTHSSSNITNFAEAVDDRVAALLVAGTNVTLTYDDTANTMTIAASGGGGGSGNSYFPSGW